MRFISPRDEGPEMLLSTLCIEQHPITKAHLAPKVRAETEQPWSGCRVAQANGLLKSPWGFTNIPHSWIRQLNQQSAYHMSVKTKI